MGPSTFILHTFRNRKAVLLGMMMHYSVTLLVQWNEISVLNASESQQAHKLGVPIPVTPGRVTPGRYF